MATQGRAFGHHAWVPLSTSVIVHVNDHLQTATSLVQGCTHAAAMPGLRFRVMEVLPLEAGAAHWPEQGSDGGGDSRTSSTRSSRRRDRRLLSSEQRHDPARGNTCLAGGDTQSTLPLSIITRDPAAAVAAAGGSSQQQAVEEQAQGLQQLLGWRVGAGGHHMPTHGTDRAQRVAAWRVRVALQPPCLEPRGSHGGSDCWQGVKGGAPSLHMTSTSARVDRQWMHRAVTKQRAADAARQQAMTDALTGSGQAVAEAKSKMRSARKQGRKVDAVAASDAVARYEPHSHTIVVSRRVFAQQVQLLQAGRCTLHVDGYPCRDAASLLLHILAHEMVHAMEECMCPFAGRDTSCRDHGPLFQRLSKRYFGTPGPSFGKIKVGLFKL